MYKITKGTFIKDLQKTKTEEEVKFAYAKHFKIKFSAAHRQDLYTPQIFFEFKYDKNFENIKVRSEILAQSLYYIHRLKYGETDQAIPPVICIADKNEACFTETEIWKDFYTDLSEKYDWDLAASQPDKNLISDIYATLEIRKIHVYKLELEHDYDDFTGRLTTYLSPQIKLFGDKKLITGNNFESVYSYWEQNFGEAVKNGQKPSKYFITDIQVGRTIQKPEESKVLFKITDTDYREKKILAKDYNYFWGLYEKVSNAYIIRDIISKADRLTDDDLRRFNGEFFTPLEFAKKGLEYIEKTIGKKWWKQGYRLWDMAAGTGNLQYHLPYEAWEYCHLSTLQEEDIEHLKKLFPEANVFQYDYLNDDIETVFIGDELPFHLNWKLPVKIREDLNNPEIKWIILINPPFATSQEAGTNHGRSKKDASNTKIRAVMHHDNLGEVSRELFSQFIYRINKEFEGKQAYLCMYSKIKYLNANNDQLLRDNVFKYKFENGFMFSVEHFHGTKGKFPVGFLIWNLHEKMQLEEQTIDLAIYEEPDLKTGNKIILNENRENFLSKWIDRPSGVHKFPPFKSGITVALNSNKDVRDRISNNFLGSLMCKGNDLQNQKYTAILSGPYVSAGALSITPDNFEQSMVVHAVRMLPKATWINDRDQFLQPNLSISSEFITDCTIWNLFSNGNQTVAMRNVMYLGNSYQIHNHFFPYLIEEIKKWTLLDSNISLTIPNNENRFVAQWLSQKDISPEASSLLNIGKEIYEFYFNNLHQLRSNKFAIQTWDAGWWQIRNALADENLAEPKIKELKNAHTVLKNKLLPYVYHYGFLG